MSRRRLLTGLGVAGLAATLPAAYYTFTREETATLRGRPLTGHTEGVDSVAFSPNSKLLATGSSHHTVRLWQL
ncbi:hypothetical protein [Streptosporangium canum]|uniref:hypothetical protein n=1 Tax=Streptosporangium canum TaxID=324952 RepID=UPI0037A807D3